jgi:hypothetical protein
MSASEEPLMFARVATFEVDDPGLIDGEVATTRRYTEGGSLPEGIPVVGFFMMIDRDGGKLVELLLFETREDLQEGDATMSAMALGEGSMRRVALDRFEVPIHIP